MKFNDESLFCCYCGHPFTICGLCTSDHLIPKVKGGVDNNYNKRNCCKRCNNTKGAKYPEQWLSELIRQYNRMYKYQYHARELYIKIENLKYIIEYVQSAGVKLFIDKYNYEVYLERRSMYENYNQKILK